MIDLTFIPLNKSQNLLFMGSNEIYGTYELCTQLFFPGPQHAVHSMHAKHAKKLLKMMKIHIVGHFNLFGHFKGMATGIIINDSPPLTMGMLVQYHTHLA